MRVFVIALCLSSIASALESSDLRCVEAGSDFQIGLPSGDTVGAAVSYDDCQKALLAAHNNLVCTKADKTSRPWKPTHLVSKAALGRYGTSLADCTELTLNASEHIVCTNTGTYSFQGRKPTYFDDKAFSQTNLIGSSGQQDYCVQASREARKGRVCGCNGDFCADEEWVLWQVSPRRAVGGSTDLKSCIASQ